MQLAAGVGRGGEQEAAGEGAAAAQGPRDDAAVRWAGGGISVVRSTRQRVCVPLPWLQQGSVLMRPFSAYNAALW